MNLSANFMLRDSLTPGPPTLSFIYRARPQVPIMGDWDGDGTRTAGAYSGGVFSLNNQNDGSPPEITFTFGDPRGFPVVGDFNRDGTEDVAVYRNGLWQVRLSTGDTYTFTFGTGTWPATIPVAGDWDGDAIDGIGTYTYATATWALRNSPTGNGGADTTFAFGTPNAGYPVPGDWNADGDDTAGVKTGTTWSLRSSNTPGPSEITFDFGGANDLPLTWKRAPAASATLTLALRQAASGGCTITLTGAGLEPNSHVSIVDTRYDEQPALSYQVDESGSITADTSQGGLGAPFTQGPATSTTAGGNPISSNTVTCP